MTRFFAVSLFLLFAIGCDEEPLPEKVEPLGSRLELAAGDVWLVIEGGKERLLTGAMLPERAELRVGQGGRALLRLGNGTAVFLRGGSAAAVDGQSVLLGQGELWAEVPEDEQQLGRFSAGKVQVTAAGAGLNLKFDGDKTELYVARGLAVVQSPGGRSEVQTGERALVQGEKAPSVEPVAFFEDWTGGMADQQLLAGIGGRASGRIYGIDRSRPGAEPAELQIISQDVRAFVRKGLAHTTVDQRFFNPSGTVLEGWYWFTLPEGASVERFALEVNGTLVEGEMVERKQARAAYEEAVERQFDPALLEWVDGRTFRARIFPIPPAGERRVVLSYTELLPQADGVYRYVYPMGSAGEMRIQEFALRVDLGEWGREIEVATGQDARVEKDKTAVSMRRSGYVPRSDFLLELKPTEEAEPIRAVRYSSGRNEADYVMVRYTPQVSWDKVEEVRGDVVIVLDTSAGGDESERQIRADAAEAILRALSAGDRFAVVAADLTSRVIFPQDGLAAAEDENVSQAVEALSEVTTAGATDLGEMFNAALALVHESEQPAVVYVGDGQATVGEMSSRELAERLRRSLAGSRARLFTIAVGGEANYGLLDRLARVGGGRLYRIDRPEQTVQEALRFVGMLKTPTMTELQIDLGAGLDQLFSTATGKISEGEEVVVFGRTHHELPDEVKITGRLAGEPVSKTYDLEVEHGAEHGYAATLWAREYLERLMGDGLEDNRGTIISLGLSYALMTPLTSFLVLESDAAYQQQGIKRRKRPSLWSHKTTPAEGIALPLLLMGCADETDAEDREDPVPAPLQMARTKEGKRHAEPTVSEEKVMERSPVESESIAAAPPAPMDGPAGARKAKLNDLVGGAMGEKSKSSSSRSKISADAEGDEAPDGLGTVLALKGQGRGGGGTGEGTIALGTGFDKPAAKRINRDQGVAQIAVGPASDRRKKKPLFKIGVCSDASRQPLYYRRILWRRRMVGVDSAGNYARLFRQAGERCELPRWRDRKALLDMIESRVGTATEVQAMIASFRRYSSLQSYLRRRILHRALDPDFLISIYPHFGVDWASVRRGLAALRTPELRLARLRQLLEDYPDDPVGRGILVELLVEADQKSEARAEASRLRRDGLAGPLVLRLLCDLQAEAGDEEEARRTCSELVEFNASDPLARQQLGDLFLRHGWYDAAYRQYRTLVEMPGATATSFLRLAAAAAGIGRVDEALRIERKVATGDGEPGPNDPRRWARLHSAVRLARMMLEANANDDQYRKLERSLKRTQVFSGETTLALLVWEDLETGLTLVPTQEGKAYPVGEQVLAPQTGLVMLDMGRQPPPELELKVLLNGRPLRRAVRFHLVFLTWDGSQFTLSEKTGQVPPLENELAV